MNNDSFVYEHPYVLKSKKHDGKILEDLFFREFGFINWLLGRSGRLDVGLWRHLNFLLEIAKNLKPKMMCPVCKKKPVKYFYLLPKGKIGERYTCCDSPACIYEIKNHYLVQQELAVGFDSVNKLPRKDAMDAAGLLMKKIYGLPRCFGPDTTFSLFQSVCPAQPNPKPQKKITVPEAVQLNLKLF